MALGANYGKKGKRKAWQEILKLLRRKQMSTRSPTGKGPPPVLIKHGIPADNTAADDPGEKYVFILDASNNRVYFCSAYTNSTTFTIIRLV